MSVTNTEGSVHVFQKLWTVQSIELLSCRPETLAALRAALVSPHQQGCWHSPNVCAENLFKKCYHELGGRASRGHGPQPSTLHATS